MPTYAQPDARGHFGPYGGSFVAETLVHALDELKEALEHYAKDPEFIREFRHELAHFVGRPTVQPILQVSVNQHLALEESTHDLLQAWDDVSWRISRLRDNPECADEEHADVSSGRPGLVVLPSFDPADD